MAKNTNEAASKNADYLQHMRCHLAGGAHYNFRESWHPRDIVFSSGKSMSLYDVDGHHYIDLYANFGANIIGQSHPQYNEKLIHHLQEMTSPPLSYLSCRVSERLCSYLPSADKIRFCVSGTEAVQTAIRLARGFTNKQKFIRFNGHYHGHSDNLLGGRPSADMPPVPEDFDGDARASEGLAQNIRAEQSILLPWNDLEKARQVISLYHDQIACILTEPLGMNAGGIEPANGYLEGLRALCDQYGILLIFDEIITGFRMGLGGAQSYYGVTPDITTLGKAIAGGMLPVAAVAGKKDIMDLLTEQRVVHAGTFNGYHAGLAAIEATLDILEQTSENGLSGLQQMYENSQFIQSAFKDAAGECEIPLTIQGHDGCFYLHVHGQKLAKPEDWSADIKAHDAALQNQLLKHGVMIAPISRCYPSVQMNEEEKDFIQARILRAFKDFSNDDFSKKG
jgi:glutamate-1-semialdehyde 2,1-aminomutase